MEGAGEEPEDQERFPRNLCDDEKVQEEAAAAAWKAVGCGDREAEAGEQAEADETAGEPAGGTVGEPADVKLQLAEAARTCLRVAEGHGEAPT